MSTDGCSVWSEVDDYLRYGRCLAEDPTNCQTVFYGGNYYVSATSDYQAAMVRSTDGGVTWPTQILLGSNGDYSTACNDIAIAFTDSQVIYAVGEENRYVRIWKSIDGGTIFTDVTNDLATHHEQYDGVNVAWVAPDDENFIIVGTDDGVFLSADGSTTWRPSNLTIPVVALAYHPAFDTLYAATSSQGVYKSEDRGLTWQVFNTGLSNLTARCLTIDEKNSGLFVGTNGASVWRTDLPAAPLWVDLTQVPATTGGSSKFHLDAGIANAGRNYLLVGGVSGTEPGYALPGGLATLPVNFDVFTYSVVFPLMNTVLFTNFLGALDTDGQAMAQLNAPPLDPMYAGLRMYYAYCLGLPWEYVSNPVEVIITP